METEIRSAYFLVVEGTTTRFFVLPSSGEVTVGSAENTSLKLSPSDAGATALRLLIDEHEVVAHPHSDGPVLLNGASFSSPRPLGNGDVLAVGEASLVFHYKTRRESAETRVDFPRLRARLVEEAERSLRTSRPLAVLAINLGATAPAGAREIVQSTLRIVDVIGWLSDTEALAILPETADTAAVPAGRILSLIRPSAPDARIGIALCPHDAQDADSLIAGARLASHHSSDAGTARVTDAARTLTVGDRPLLAADPAMNRVLELVERLAKSDIPVLVTGETGVGKELVALALHEWSRRRGRPFVALNCAAVAETLFESELFGHERGAFTDAKSAKAGLLEKAKGGTLLLDEIGELPQRLQAKLLRAIETGKISRVGAVDEKQVDARIVAATNRDLDARLADGTFRQDLYFRLAAARVIIPPLRQRPLDIPILAAAFLDEACSRAGRKPIRIEPEAMRRLCMHSWPGNVRELRNLMDLMAATLERDRMLPQNLPETIVEAMAPWLRPRPDDRAAAVTEQEPATAGGPGLVRKRPSGRMKPFTSLKEEVRELEKTRIEEALAATGGVQVKAAALLKMPLRTFISKMKTYKIDPIRFK
jgi:two-component system response regulator AtoC